MIKLCVFDLDGTLVDSHKDLAAGVNFALAKRGLPTIPSETYITFIGDGAKMLVTRALGDKGGDEALVNEVLHDFSDYYAAHLTDHTTVYEGMGDVVGALRMHGILCAIFTNKPDSHSKNIARALFGKDAFCAVVGNDPGFPKKPDPTALKVLLSAFDVAKDECLFIGDSEIDIATAKAAGVKAIGVPWGFSREAMIAAGPDYLITCASEIRDIATGKRD